MKSFLIGKPSIFAVEYEVDDKYEDSWLFGKFCYWINNIQVGEFLLGVSLRDILVCLPSVVRDNGNRQHIRLFQLSPEDLCKQLNTLYDGNSLYEEIAQKEIWDRFKIDLPIDIFNDWKVYLIENEMRARIVYSYREEAISDIYLELGVFDKVISDTLSSIDSIYEQLSVSSAESISDL